MKFYYQIVTTPTADTPGTVTLLHFPNKRYLFGRVSEGTQRAMTENGAKLSGISQVFLTGPMSWNNSGGLIGVILTKADGVSTSMTAQEAVEREKEANRQKHGGQQPLGKSGAKLQEQPAQPGAGEEQHDLTVHGPRNLAHTLATARRFVFRKGLPVYTKEYDTEGVWGGQGNADDPFETPTWFDENIKVWVMPIKPSSASGFSSPRKRSLDEFREDASQVVEVDRKSQDQLARESVVADMFNSDWHLDSLEETRLADVKLPAQIFVRNPETKDLEKYTGPLPGNGTEVPEMNVLVRKPWPGASIEKIPTAQRCDESLCYIVKNHNLRGKFDPKRAMALGVEKGRNFGMLTAGESVKSADGKVITPEMVMEPARPGKGLAVMDLPSSEYVQSLLSRPEWKSPSVMSNLEAFIWILGPGVGDDPRLQKFVASMPNCKHIVSSQDYCPNYLALQSAAGSAIRLARLRPDNYAVPEHNNDARFLQTLSSINPIFAESQVSSPYLPAEPGLIVNMEPEFKINTSEVVPRLNIPTLLEKMPSTAVRRADIISKRLRAPDQLKRLEQFQKDLPGADAEIFTLGTGSSAPSKYRNVSSTLVHVPSSGYYLLDCGESTLGQLQRQFNPKKLREVLQNLRMVWISHLHADHHLGIVSVLKAWYQENYPDGVPLSNAIEPSINKILEEKRLFVVSDGMMVEWLEEYAGVEDFGFSKLIPLCASPYRHDGKLKTSLVYRHCRADGSYPKRELPESKPAQTELRYNKDDPTTFLLRKATGLTDLLTTYVSHCRGAMAVSLVFHSGFKISFSGDCRPSNTFAEIGEDSTVLIHEATFDDSMAGSAIAKKHSTTGEAIQIGRQMRARAILLTHFSQRYQKIAEVEQHDANEKPKATETPQQGTPTTTAAAPDIPLDNDAQEDLTSGHRWPRYTPESKKPAPAVVPIVTAFDLMRVRVRDMYTLGAYAPATERLFTVIERAGAHDARLASLKQQLESKKQGKNKKRNKNQKGKSPPNGKRGASKSRSPSPSRQLLEPTPSIWDAPESESGWSSSDSGKGASF